MGYINPTIIMGGVIYLLPAEKVDRSIKVKVHINIGMMIKNIKDIKIMRQLTNDCQGNLIRFSNINNIAITL
jgi:hypothetical protein